MVLQSSLQFRATPPLSKWSQTPAIASDWSYGCCPLDACARSFGPFASLVETWQQRRPDGGGLPPRRAFEINDFGAWLGRIFIAKIELDPIDIRFTLWGTTLADWWGVDYTGESLGKQSESPESWATERRYFEAMSKSPFIGIAGGLLTQHKRDHIKVLGLDLPMSDRGGALTRVLSAHIRIDLDHSFRTIAPDCPITPFDGDGP